MLQSQPLESAPAECIIRAGNAYKILWDVYIFVLVIVVCIVVPFRLAFFLYEDSGWLIFYGIVDISFLIDIILTFFTSVYDSESQLEIVEK